MPSKLCTEKQKAHRARLAKILTAGRKRTRVYTEIAEQVGCGISAVTHWFRGRTNSRTISRIVHRRARMVQTKARELATELEAQRGTQEESAA